MPLSIGVANSVVSSSNQLFGAGAFTPAALTNLFFWIEAGPTQCFKDIARTQPCAVGDSVAAWADKSGQGFHVTQATGANQPTLQQDAGGKYYVSFGGSALLDRLAIGLRSQANTMAAAVRRTAGTIVLSGGGSVSSAGASILRGSTLAGLNCGLTIQSGSMSTVDRAVIAICNGASSAVYLDGSQTVTGDAGTGAIDELHVGAGDSLATPFTGRIYGAVMANTLVSAQLAALHTYLRNLMP